MNIIFARSGNPREEGWVEMFRKVLPPEVTLSTWTPDGPSVNADAAIVWGPPADLLRREPGIKAVFNMGAGVDAIFKLEGLHEGITLVRLEDAGMAVQMAEYAAYALLRASRRFDQYEVSQKAVEWKPLPDIKRSEWPVGVLGIGLMGKRVAQVLAGMDYPVASWARSDQRIDGVQTFAGRDRLNEFLARTRVLVNTLPLTDDTRNILCRDTLERLMPGCYLINIARGEHVVDEDLLNVLNSGHMLGATLDVFRTEPLPPEHPFWTHPRVTVTPHVAAASLLDETVAQIGRKVRQYMNGEPVSGTVVWNRGY